MVILILADPLATVGYRIAGARIPDFIRSFDFFNAVSSSPIIIGIIAPAGISKFNLSQSEVIFFF